MDFSNNQASAQAAAAQKSVYMQQTTAAPELQSTHIINRLKNLRHSLKELNASTDSAATKIIGYPPTPINVANIAGVLGGAVQADRDPVCFLDAITQLMTDIENVVEVELRENVNRFHRFF